MNRSFYLDQDSVGDPKLDGFSILSNLKPR